jgi:hypothetical protein
VTAAARTPTTASATTTAASAAPHLAPTAPASPAPPALPPLADQAERLVALGVPALAGLPADDVRAAAARLAAATPPGSLLVVDPALAPPSALAPLLRLPVPGGERAGFVVVDMTDVDRFAPIDGLVVPPGPLYAVTGPDRGDDLAGWSPHEALPELTARGRTPLLLAEGVHWALQAPGVVERNRCFMTIGSRLRTPRGALDARTPAIWVSNGTGRDGRERRGAPKVGWCWAGNRHTWLGFASGVARQGLPG